MNWFRRLFSRQPITDQKTPSVAIPIPEGSDPAMWSRVAPPKRNRKKFTDEEIEADQKRYAEEMRRNSIAHSEFDRNRALSIGCKSYIWRAAGDGDTCAECARNNGKRFSYRRRPKIGHPGEHACPMGWCRCYAEPNVPK
jgi:uncharacterized protein with gpF-like domain